MPSNGTTFPHMTPPDSKDNEKNKGSPDRSPKTAPDFPREGSRPSQGAPPDSANKEGVSWIRIQGQTAHVAESSRSF